MLWDADKLQKIIHINNFCIDGRGLKVAQLDSAHLPCSGLLIGGGQNQLSTFGIKLGLVAFSFLWGQVAIYSLPKIIRINNFCIDGLWIAGSPIGLSPLIEGGPIQLSTSVLLGAVGFSQKRR